MRIVKALMALAMACLMVTPAFSMPLDNDAGNRDRDQGSPAGNCVADVDDCCAGFWMLQINDPTAMKDMTIGEMMKQRQTKCDSNNDNSDVGFNMFQVREEMTIGEMMPNAGKNAPEAGKVDAGKNVPEAGTCSGSAGKNAPETGNVGAGKNAPEAGKCDAGKNAPEAGNTDAGCWMFSMSDLDGMKDMTIGELMNQRQNNVCNNVCDNKCDSSNEMVNSDAKVDKRGAGIKMFQMSELMGMEDMTIGELMNGGKKNI